MLYYLPDGVSIQARGIKPDFTVKPKFVPVDEMKWVNELYGKETALKNHITVEEVTGEKAVQPKKEKRSFWQRWFTKNDDADDDENASDVNVSGFDEEYDSQDYDSSDQLSRSKKRKKKKSWKQEQQEALALDIQVQASVNMINLLNLAKKMNEELVNNREKALSFLKEHYLTDDVVKVEEVK